MVRISKSEKVPKPLQNIFNEIVALTDTFCATHLDEEYAQLGASSHGGFVPPAPFSTCYGLCADLGVRDCLCFGVCEFSV